MTNAVPLTSGIAIVDEAGAPTVWFIQLWQNSVAKALSAQSTATGTALDLATVQLAPASAVVNAASAFGVGPTL